jgi:hypothetical protein
MNLVVIKIISALFCLIFISFAILQYNDPDPIFWIAIYATIAIVSFLRVVNRQSKKIALITLIAIGIISLFYLPGFYEWITMPNKEEIFGEMVYEKPYIEETREFFGLLMGAGSLLFQYRHA